MLVTITQASKLVGKARKTIYAHAKAGKVSLSKFSDGKTAIDTSELYRVYGDLKEKVTLKPLQTEDSVTDGNTVLNVLTELKNENSLMREEMQKLREEIKNLNNRLEHKPVPSDAVEPLSVKAKSNNEISSLMAKIKAKPVREDK